MSLNLFARQRFPPILEGKSLLKIIGCQIWSSLKCPETNRQIIQNRYCRHYSTGKEKPKDNEEIVKSQQPLGGGELATGAFESVKETTKTITYTGIIVIGLGVTGILCYAIFCELFSTNSPTNIYSKAFDRCLKNEKVLMSLGEPIKAFGEEKNLRGRRAYTNHLLYKKDGINFLRMKFYIRGSRKKATVHLEMKENENKNFEYRYLFVQLDEFPYTTIVLEDNRSEKASLVQPINEKMELT